MGRLQGLRLIGGNLVGLLCELDHTLALVASDEFAEVSEIITLHLKEEDLSLGILGVGNEGVV